MTNVPMLPSLSDIEQMKKFKSIADENNTPREYYTDLSLNKKPIQSKQHIMENKINNSASNIQNMKNILEKLHKIDNNILIETKSINKEIVETWKVKTNILENSSNKPKKTFNVFNNKTSQSILENLTLNESAKAISLFLNKGLTIEHNKIQEIINLTETFNISRLEANKFKQRYQRCIELKETEAGNIFSKKFQISKTNAIVAYDKIKSILENIS